MNQSITKSVKFLEFFYYQTSAICHNAKLQFKVKISIEYTPCSTRIARLLNRQYNVVASVILFSI